MKHLLIFFLSILSLSSFAQVPALDDIVRNNTLTPAKVANALDASIVFTASGTNTYTINPGLGIYSGTATYASGDVFKVTFSNTNSSTTTSLNVNSEGAISMKDASGSDLAVSSIKVGSAYLLYYNGTHFRVLNMGGSSVSFGTDKQIPFMNSGGTDYLYSTNFTFNTSTKSLLVGVGNSNTSSSYGVFGDSNTITGGGWGVVGGELCTVTGGGGDLALFGLRNTTNRGSTLTWGTDCSNFAAGSVVGGYKATVTVGTNVPGVAIGIGAAATNPVLAVAGAVNISHNSAIGSGLGSNALYSAILAGTDNYIVAGANNSAIIGGNKMSMPATDTSMVYVPNLRIRSGIGTGTRNVVVNSTGYVSYSNSYTGGYVAKTANYTLTFDDYLVNCTSNSFTITLPSAVGVAGRMFIIKNTGSATTITIATTSSQTIDGSAPGTITTLDPLRVMSDGANWITF
jgi:hypothetical protein